MENLPLSERVKWLQEHRNITLKEIGDAAGVSQAAISQWKKGLTQNIKADVASKIARAFNVSVSWLATGIGDPTQQDIDVIDDFDGEAPNSDKYVQIPAYSMKFCCTPGDTSGQRTYEETNEPIPVTYKLSWFQSRHRNPAHCARFRVHGTSMQPLLYNNDEVLVDLSDNVDIVSNGVYAISINDSIKIKRLVPLLKGGYIVKSDNPDVPDETIEPEDFENIYFKIHGRVIDRSGSGGL